jgi:hypothetical protein
VPGLTSAYLGRLDVTAGGAFSSCTPFTSVEKATRS